jgi:hypothetical protein
MRHTLKLIAKVEKEWIDRIGLQSSMIGCVHLPEVRMLDARPAHSRLNVTRTEFGTSTIHCLVPNYHLAWQR